MLCVAIIAGFEWLNMVNEMGNNKSSQQANHGDDSRRRNQINREGGEGKDLHEKVEQPKGGDPPAAKRTSDDKGWFSALLLNLT